MKKNIWQKVLYVIRLFCVLAAIFFSMAEISFAEYFPDFCEVDQNKDYLLKTTVPKYDFHQAVQPRIRSISKKHYSSLSRYSIPLSEFWDLTGLGLFFPNSNFAKCSCEGDVIFIKDKLSKTKANFYFLDDNNLLPYSESNLNKAINTKFFVGLNLIRGEAYIGPDHIDMHFNEGDVELKIIKLKGHGEVADTTLFDDSVKCSSLHRPWAVLNKFKPNGKQVPNLNIIIEPEKK